MNLTRANADYMRYVVQVSPSSNRMGIRLEGPKLDWARKDGGMGGSHPSNVLDCGYALGAVNIVRLSSSSLFPLFIPLPFTPYPFSILRSILPSFHSFQAEYGDG